MEENVENEKKAIVEKIKEYFKLCPYLNELSDVKVDYLDIDTKDQEPWSIEQVEAPIILHKNVLGTITERQCQFVIASRSYFNPLVDTQNIKNLHLFEKIANWLYTNTHKGILPILNDGETAISIEAINSGYLYGTDKTNTYARYQIECLLKYEKKEESKWHLNY